MRTYTFLLTILISVVSAVAQTWTPVDEHKYNDETIVYVRLSTGDTSADNDPSRYCVGAFIDGECRGTADAILGDNGTYLYVVRVRGAADSDHGKPITFLVYDRTSAYDFDATPSRPVMFTGESEGEPSDCVVLSFVGHFVSLQGFTVSVGPLCAGETSQMVLTPIPADATFHSQSMTLLFSCFPSHWTAAGCSLASTAPLAFQVTPYVPGALTVKLNDGQIPLYDASGNAITTLPVAAPVRLSDGWQWMTNAYGDVSTEDDFRQVYGGDNLVEIRTHEHLLYDDPEWGYFGTLLDVGLPQGTAYKVRMANGRSHLGLLWNGRYQRGTTFRVESGWSWIPSPYYYNRLFTSAFPEDDVLPHGLIIISKEGGQVEWDGSEWAGDLPALMAGQYFLCFNPSDDAFTLTYADEFVMAQGDEATAVAPVGPWEFDASLFSDNMTMVATVPGLDSPDDYVIGAFVGSECRGEGHWVDGRFFITAHVDGFEDVKFRLCHLPTGREYGIDESVGVQLHLGSVSHPVPLHSTEYLTGIVSTLSPDSQSTERYDLMGRRVSSSHRGITIIRSTSKTQKMIIKQ